MNCNQAQTLLSIYRELKSEEVDTTELDAHVEACATCRAVLANTTFVGEQMRATSLLTPPPELHTKLMQALADEQLRALQKSAPGKVSTPAFLKPYVQQRAHQTKTQDEIAAFSTAETGPLPFIKARRRRRPLRANQFGILGLAAAALILLMMGGLTSLLVVARNNPTSLTKSVASVNRPIEVDRKLYATRTLYAHVASALPVGNDVYYSASGDGDQGTDYMLMQFDRATQTNTPLLAMPSSDPVIVLSASQHWLVWLQFSRPPGLPHAGLLGKGMNKGQSAAQRAWSIHYLSLLPQSQNTAVSQVQSTGKNVSAAQPASFPTAATGSTTNQSVAVPTSLVLARGDFDSYTAPSWVATPIQGTWLMDDTLLVAHVDQQGISHLQSYLLGQTGKAAQVQEVASAPAGHVLAWPTADSTGTLLYWADEWVSADGLLQSNVWQQQTDTHLMREHGQLRQVVSRDQQLYLGDGMSFQPQIVEDTLFFLSTSEIKVSSQGVVTPNGVPLPASATDTSVTFTPRTAPAVYASPADAAVHGTIFTVPLNGLESERENTLGTVGQSTGFHAGSSYLIWQDSDGYQMYDVHRQANVTLGNTLNAASLLAVNGNTAFWLANQKSASSTNLTLLTFNWPN